MNVTNINNGYGEEKQKMHPTNIKQEVGHLGPHERIFDVGDKKKVKSQEINDGPLWITTQ